jgi:hypothetical protein
MKHSLAIGVIGLLVANSSISAAIGSFLTGVVNKKVEVVREEVKQDVKDVKAEVKQEVKDVKEQVKGVKQEMQDDINRNG